MTEPYVSRVNQLDAIQLDKEITNIFLEQLSNVYKELPPGLLSKYQPEIEASIKSLIWYSSIFKGGSTFGQRLLSLSYQSDKLTTNKMMIHYSATILAQYVKEVSQLRLTNRVLLQQLISWIEFTTKFLNIINIFRFLYTGSYSTPLEYVLKMRHTQIANNSPRAMGYAYMSRELIWSGFMELLGVTLPLINYHAIRRKAIKIFKKPNLNISQNVVPVFTIHTACAYCSQRPSLPHHIGCQHVFCYYCIRANKKADPDFACPLCDLKCNKIQALEI